MLIVLGGCYIYTIFLMFVLTIQDGLTSVAMLPSEFKYYKGINGVNLFGRILLSAFSIFINPVTAILRFLNWIFHVRKE